MMKDAEKASLTKLYNPFRNEKKEEAYLNESVRLLKRKISIIDFPHSFSFIFHFNLAPTPTEIQKEMTLL